MVGTGVPMLLDSASDRPFVTPRHHGIEEAVGASVGKVVVAKALATPTIDVVFKLQIARERLACGTARSRWVGLEQDPDFRAQ